MNTRERLIGSLYSRMCCIGAAKWSDAEEEVDNILDALMEPGKRVLCDASATDPNTEQGHRLPFLDEETMRYIWQALLIAVRDGK